MKKTSIYDCSMLEIDKHHNEKGNISVIENDRTIPFSIERVYYLYDVPGGESRGGHAHKKLQQFVVAVSGSFDVTVDDGESRRTFTVNRPYRGVLVVPGIWRELDNFSSGSVCLVLASTEYLEDDYIRDYNSLKNIRNDFLPIYRAG